MDLKARLEKAKAELDAARSRISDDDRAEIELRAQVEKAEADALAEKEKLRDLALARRLDVAREKLGDVKCDSLAIQGFDDTFIVFRSGAAHKRWLATQQAAATQEARGKHGIDREKINVQYAVDSVFDWNGITDFSNVTGTENADKLRRFLEENPGVVGPITTLAGTLNGAYAEEKKG